MSDTVTEAAAEQKTDEAKTYSEEQFKGLLADKQSEVKKRQAIETELAELKAGQVKEHSGIAGSLDLDKRVVDMGKKGFPVHIRVSWENDKGHVFEITRTGEIVWDFWNPTTMNDKKATIFRMLRYERN